MTFFVRRCLILFLGFELLIFFVVYCFGPNSLKSLYDIKVLQNATHSEIVQLQHEIERLKSDVLKNQTDFAKEKIARQRLLMKKQDETIYFKTTVR